MLHIAQYILENYAPMTALKLHKLLYYCQVWNLVWKEKPLFPEDFEAWACGPVIKQLYQTHIGMLMLGPNFIKGHQQPTEEEKEVIQKVFEFYGEKTNQWLALLVKREKPFLETREENDQDPRSGEIIDKTIIFEYYSSLNGEEEEEVKKEQEQETPITSDIIHIPKS